MSKQLNAIPNWQPSPQVDFLLPTLDPGALKRRWWQKARPSRSDQETPGLVITWTPPLPDYEARLRPWRPQTAPPNANRRWLASGSMSRTMSWARSRKRWRPQTAR